MRKVEWKQPLLVALCGTAMAIPGAAWMGWIWWVNAWPSYFPLILMFPGLAIAAFGFVWLLINLIKPNRVQAHGFSVIAKKD